MRGGCSLIGMLISLHGLGGMYDKGHAWLGGIHGMHTPCMVSKHAVRILLECYLMHKYKYHKYAFQQDRQTRAKHYLAPNFVLQAVKIKF